MNLIIPTTCQLLEHVLAEEPWSSCEKLDVRGTVLTEGDSFHALRALLSSSIQCTVASPRRLKVRQAPRVDLQLAGREFPPKRKFCKLLDHKSGTGDDYQISMERIASLTGISVREKQQ